MFPVTIEIYSSDFRALFWIDANKAFDDAKLTDKDPITNAIIVAISSESRVIFTVGLMDDSLRIASLTSLSLERWLFSLPSIMALPIGYPGAALAGSRVDARGATGAARLTEHAGAELVHRKLIREAGRVEVRRRPHRDRPQWSLVISNEPERRMDCGPFCDLSSLSHHVPPELLPKEERSRSTACERVVSPQSVEPVRLPLHRPHPLVPVIAAQSGGRSGGSGAVPQCRSTRGHMGEDARKPDRNPYPCRTYWISAASRASAKCLKVLAPRAGFEPATNRLTAGCSTTELPGIRRSYSRRGL